MHSVSLVFPAGPSRHEGQRQHHSASEGGQSEGGSNQLAQGFCLACLGEVNLDLIAQWRYQSNNSEIEDCKIVCNVYSDRGSISCADGVKFIGSGQHAMHFGWLRQQHLAETVYALLDANCTGIATMTSQVASYQQQLGH
jgi:hypothetical protein